MTGLALPAKSDNEGDMELAITIMVRSFQIIKQKGKWNNSTNCLTTRIRLGRLGRVGTVPAMENRLRLAVDDRTMYHTVHPVE